MKRITLALLLAFSLSSHAATLVLNGNGQLAGAKGVDVDGALYDVTIGYNVPGNACCGPNFLEFTDVASAEAATQALSEQVIVGSQLLPPLNIYGINLLKEFRSSSLVTPYRLYTFDNDIIHEPDRVAGASIRFYWDENDSVIKTLSHWDESQTASPGGPAGVSSYGNFMYVIWTPVPIPASAWLFGSSLIGILLARRNK